MEEHTCTVCGGTLDDFGLGSCHYCGNRFHHPWNTSDGSPCGQLISHGEALIVVFICNHCYNQAEQ